MHRRKQVIAFCARAGIAPLAFLALVTISAGCSHSDDSTANAKPAGVTPHASGATGGAAREGESPNEPRSALSQDVEYAALLTKIVNDDGLVRYEVLSSDAASKQLDAAVEKLSLATLPAATDVAGRKALWCNAYNANVLKLVMIEKKKDGFRNVNSVPGFFDEMKITVAGESMTLNGLKDRLRALKDPRIHGALVAGAKSSPALRAQPYTALEIDRELDEQCRTWLEDLSKNRVVTDGLRLSSIFQTYVKDFEGEPSNGVVGFVKRQARPASVMRDVIRNLKDLHLTYLTFDWSLNNAEDEKPFKAHSASGN